MIQPKLRRALASTALVSALTLLPIRNAGAEPRVRWEKEGREVSRRAAPRPSSLWDLLARLLAKASVRIDPDGNKASVRIDPDGRH